MVESVTVLPRDIGVKFLSRSFVQYDSFHQFPISKWCSDDEFDGLVVYSGHAVYDGVHHSELHAGWSHNGVQTAYFPNYSRHADAGNHNVRWDPDELPELEPEGSNLQPLT